MNFGTFDNQVYRNSDDPVREYRAVHLLARCPLRDNWSAQANWTVQLRNHGNFEGEGTNTPAISSFIGDRPELYTKDRHFPEGRLNDFQRHRLLAWTTYGAEMGFLGGADLSVLYR